MANLDFSPLYRSTIGFDRVPQMLQSVMRANSTERESCFYNIEKHDDDIYKIVLAVPGYSLNNIDIVAEQNQLTVSGSAKDIDDAEYLHHGFSNAPFTQKFALADHVEVTGAELLNGLLVIELKHEIPERLKPRRIKIDKHKAGTSMQETQSKQAA